VPFTRDVTAIRDDVAVWGRCPRMSMMPPPFAADPDDDGIPAADPGAGAPDPSRGFGVGGEEPDVAESEDPDDAEAPSPSPSETPFRTPDPRTIGPQD
jgi:hypothetical protein